MPGADITAIIEWEDETQEVTDVMNTVANVGEYFSRTLSVTIGATIQLQQSNFTLIQAYRAQRDAKREINRWKRRHTELDIEQAKLTVKLIERQRLLTAQGGTYIDIQQANLNKRKALRDVQTTQFAIDDRHRKMYEANFDAEMRGNIAVNQVRLLRIQLGLEIGILISTITAMIVARWAKITAMLTVEGIATLGISVAIGLGIITASIALVHSMTPPMPEAPGGQTELGQVRRITRGGIMEVHRGEVIGNFIEENNDYIININAPNVRANDFIGMENIFAGVFSNA